HARRTVAGGARRQRRHRGSSDAPGDVGAEGRIVKKLWEVRELSTVAILVLEVLFFAWYLWPEGNRAHPFINTGNAVLILNYASIYATAAVGAAFVSISGGIDLAPGAVIALAGVVCADLYVQSGWSLGTSMVAGLLVGVASGLLSSALIVLVRLPPFI